VLDVYLAPEDIPERLFAVNQRFNEIVALRMALPGALLPGTLLSRDDIAKHMMHRKGRVQAAVALMDALFNKTPAVIFVCIKCKLVRDACRCWDYQRNPLFRGEVSRGWAIVPSSLGELTDGELRALGPKVRESYKTLLLNLKKDDGTQALPDSAD
jgi:hypothetical protein